MEDENEASVLDTSQKLAQITIEDKKVPLNDVTNTPNKVKVEKKKVENSADREIDNSPNEDDQVIYNKLITKAKKYTGQGMIKKALELNQKALKICFSEKLSKKVTKMETYLKEYGEGESESEDDNGIINVGNGFHLYKDLYDKLYRHQKEGVLWMWSLFKKKKGGILGDDMGLGKTIQVISFLSGMFDMEKIHYVLIVMPVALVVNWENEFNKWAPGINITAYHGTSKRERERSLAKVQRRGGVLITTYGMVVTSWAQLGNKDGREFTWDYMILDEGHKIKNPTKTTKGVYNIPARNRLILTGTPVQNNLRELWALFDFAHNGTLLGTARTFKMEFDNPITRSREKDAVLTEKKLGQEMSETLKKIIAPFFLRRTKAEVQAKKNERLEGDEKEHRKSAQMPNLTRKNELVIWLYLTQIQQKIYQDFLELDEVKMLLMTTRSPLVALTVLKKICDHPRLLSTAACAQLGLDGHDDLDVDGPEALESASNKIEHVNDHILIQESGKLMVLVELLDNLKSEGHRCLVFSQSRKILDIIQKLVSNRGHKIVRLDGTISQTADREAIIQKFQTDDSYSIFLLTTQVGGVGLTLTSADRVVIYDPSWNPATDAQAVDRVFRIGQNKNVVIYRLITCGTVEEKIYRRQIFKDSITRQTTGNSKNPYRYFTKQDLKELFKLGDPRSSTTQIQLQDMHTTDRRSDVQLDAHIAFLHTLEMFGVSDHDLMFSQEVPHEEPTHESDQTNMSAGEDANYIQNRIQRAQQLIEMESSQPPDMNIRFEKKATTFQPGERPMPVWNPKPPSSYTQQDHKPTMPDKRTIDLTVVTSPVQSTSPSSPIEIDDDDEVQDMKPPVNETKSVKNEIKDEEEDDDNVPLDFGLDDLKDEPVSDYLENRVKTESVDLVSNKTSDETVDPVSNQSIDSGSELESFENDSSEQNSKQSVDHGKLCDSDKNMPSVKHSESEKVQNEIASPFKIPDIPTSSPFMKKTPKQKQRIIEEELIISPDAGSPLLSYRKANIPVHLRLSGSSKKLNMSPVSQTPESPLTKPTPPSSSEYLVENSPDCSFDTVKPLKKDGISSEMNKEGPVCNIMDLKSPEQEKAEETMVEDSMFDDSEEELSDSESPISTKRTCNQRKNAIESSDEEDMIPTNTTRRKQRIEDTEDEDEASENNEENEIEADQFENKVNSNESESDQIESEADQSESEVDQSESEVDQSESEVDQSESEASRNEGEDDHKKIETDLIENEATEDEMEDNDSQEADTNEDEAEDLGSEDEFVEDKDGMDNEDVVDVDDVSDGDGVELDEDDDEDDDKDYGGSFIDDGNNDSEEGNDEEEESEEEGEDGGFDDLPEDLKLKFNECLQSCSVQYKAKNYEEALAFVLQGLEIFPDPALQQQALKIHKKINK